MEKPSPRFWFRYACMGAMGISTSIMFIAS